MTDLYIRDKETGRVHRVGDDSHDQLWVHEGVVRYYNLQNGDGSGEGGGYEFVDSGIYGEIPEEDFKQAEEFRKGKEAFRVRQKELAKQGIILMS